MLNSHISKVIALFVSTPEWQSGGNAPYCRTAMTACWVLPKLPSGRWAAHFPLVPLLPLTSPLHCLSPALFRSLSFPTFNSLSRSLYLSISTSYSLSLSCKVPHLHLCINLPPGLDNTQKRVEAWTLKGGWRGKKRGQQHISCAWWSAIFCSFFPPLFVSHQCQLHITVFSPLL